MKFFIFGFGYTAKFLAPKLIAAGFKVIGTSRKPPAEASNQNLEIIKFPLHNDIKNSTHILISIPPIYPLGDIVLANFQELILKQAPHLQWLGYLSSTGVYGDAQGNWVDEESICNPHTATGIARLKAEKAWNEFAKQHNLPLHIFRLSGIYGPNRCVFDKIKQGKKQTIFKKNQVFCRIHVEDIVATILASIKSPNPISIYNVSDDEPAPSHLIDSFAAKLLQLSPPRIIDFKDADLSPMEQEFYANNRRVSNLKIKKELNIKLKYPTFREGLIQLMNETL